MTPLDVPPSGSDEARKLGPSCLVLGFAFIALIGAALGAMVAIGGF